MVLCGNYIGCCSYQNLQCNNTPLLISLCFLHYQIDQLEGLTNTEFRQMEQKTAMWLENNVRFSTGSTLARSEKAMSVVSEGGLSSREPQSPHTPTTPTTPGYRDKSWV
jgi:hypothetical protein